MLKSKVPYSCFKAGIAVALSMVFLSCNETANRSIAEQAVSEFHTHLNAGQYELIYAAADNSFRTTSSKRDFLALLQSVHNKLGNVTHASPKSSQVGWFAGKGTIVTLVYDTEFRVGKAGEKFIWTIDGSHALLHGYYISSNQLVTK